MFIVISIALDGNIAISMMDGPINRLEITRDSFRPNLSAMNPIGRAATRTVILLMVEINPMKVSS